MLIIKNLTLGGSLSKTHGYQGQIRLHLRNDIQIPESFPSFIFLMITKKPVPFYIEEAGYLDDQTLLVKLEGIDTKEEAAEYTGMSFYLRLEDCDSANTFDPEVLIGFEVVDQHGTGRGKVMNIIPNPAHYLVELDNDLLLPLHSDLIINIDTDKKVINLRIADGL